MIKKLDHLVITTAHIQECIEFYKKLGFTPRNSDNRYELFAGDFKINVHILGQELLPHAKNVQVGSGDLCFEIDGALDEFKKSLEEKGILIELGIVGRSGSRGAMRSIYLRDMDGNLIEFCSYN